MVQGAIRQIFFKLILKNKRILLIWWNKKVNKTCLPITINIKWRAASLQCRRLTFRCCNANGRRDGSHKIRRRLMVGREIDCCWRGGVERWLLTTGSGVVQPRDGRVSVQTWKSCERAWERWGIFWVVGETSTWRFGRYLYILFFFKYKTDYPKWIAKPIRFTLSIRSVLSSN